jgi:hypothetical protein
METLNKSALFINLHTLQCVIGITIVVSQPWLISGQKGKDFCGTIQHIFQDVILTSSVTVTVII